LRDDQHRRPRRVHGLVGLRPFATPDLPSRTTLFAHGSFASSLRRRHAFACVSAFVARDRPSVANQSRRQGTTGILVTTGPASSSWRGRAPLLRFRVPFSTHRPRRALVPKAAGPRTCPAPAFCARRSPALHRPRTCDGDRFALAVFRFIGEGVRRRPIRWTHSGRVLRFRIQPRPLHATLAERTGSCRLELRRLRSVARVRSVKPTRLMFFPHARGGPADRASHFRRLVISPPGRVMRRRVLFARRSATRIPGQSRGLAGRVVLPSF